MEHFRFRAWLILFSIIIIQAIFLIHDRNGVKQQPREIPEYYKLHEEEDKSWPDKVVNDPVALFTLVLTAFTGGLYLATRSLWTSTENLVRGAEETARIQLRAYVHVDRAEIEGIREGDTPSSRFSVRNYGKTPAYDLHWYIEMGFYYFDKLSFPPASFGERKANLGPGAEAERILDWAHRIEGWHKESIKAETGAVFFYGYVTYKDVFGASHTTSYRFLYRDKFTTNGEPCLEIHSTGNDCD